MRHLRVTGSCLGRAPARLPNNEEQAAKPKSGAKNPWNVRREPKATPSATSERAFLCGE